MIDVRGNGSGGKVRVTAPPTDGKANAELVALLSETFGVARSAITIIAGHTSRDKIVAIAGLSVDEVRRALPA
jgi:uncharacterized protein (TIGR00251 family)